MRYTCFIFLLLSVTLDAQESLNNETILKLVKAGIGEETIVAMVNQQPGKYSLSTDNIIALKNAGVSDKVIGAMISRNGAANATALSNVGATGDCEPAGAVGDKLSDP